MNPNHNTPQTGSKAVLAQQRYIEQVQQLLAERYGERLPLCHVHSYGCQQNVSDGEKLKGMLAQLGYGFCDHPTDADFVLYNTCAVRENAENRIFGNVGALKALKQQKKGMLIGLCGCMMQQQEMVERIKSKFPYVDLVFGTHVLHRLPELLFEVLSTQTNVYQIEDTGGEIVEEIPIHRDGTIKTGVPIMYGCDNFCTYCIVPHVRGRERSRSPQAILDEIAGLIAAGFREITLLGQNVNSYAPDPAQLGESGAGCVDFAGLLRAINALPGDFRVRFMTSHPKDASRELLDTMASCEKICKHFHLPVQSGSNRILKAMNRGYTRESYLELISYARTVMPQLSFSSDIIVGFPGETREDFEQTKSLVEAVGYDVLYTFIYSKRPGTAAATLPDPVPYAEKARWLNELLSIQQPISHQNVAKQVGKRVRVLVEAEGKTAPGYLMGRTDSFLVVEFKGSLPQIGSFVEVELMDSKNFTLLGRQISNQEVTPS